MALGDKGLRPYHCLVRGTPRAEAVAVLAEGRVPQRLQLLQNRLLDHEVAEVVGAEASSLLVACQCLCASEVFILGNSPVLIQINAVIEGAHHQPW